jgi:hypothetical protein
MKRSSRNHSGYTLLELVICMPLVLLLMLGMGAAIYLSGKTLPDDQSQTYQTLLAGQALDQLTFDLRYATAISNGGSRDITFTVPDRDSDAAGETIRYLWSGVAGQPLSRQVNGSAAEVLVPAVNSFGLSYATYVNAATGKTHAQAIDVTLLLNTSGSPLRTLTAARLLNEPQLGP